MPAVEEYGVEPIPAELRTVGWRDLFAINFTFFLNPVMYVLGAFAVVDGGLPLWWAMATMVAGQALAFALLTVVAQPGVDYGLTGQVAMRTHLGLLGGTPALVSVPGRRGDLLVRGAGAGRAGSDAQAIYEAMTGHRPAARPARARLRRRARDARRARLRRDAMAPARRAAAVARVHRRSRRPLPRRPTIPRYAVRRVFDSPGPAPDLGRLRDLRDGDVRRVAHARHERRRLLPLHADAARHADRARRLGPRLRGRDHVRRRLRGGCDRRDEPVRRRRRPDLEQRPARRRSWSRSSSRGSPRTSPTSTPPGSPW